MGIRISLDTDDDPSAVFDIICGNDTMAREHLTKEVGYYVNEHEIVIPLDISVKIQDCLRQAGFNVKPTYPDPIIFTAEDWGASSDDSTDFE